ncbi:MAG: hypothetical protein DMG90_09820, partial [Acidobacteria bacterium]
DVKNHPPSLRQFTILKNTRFMTAGKERTYVLAGVWASPSLGFGECTILLCKSNIARISSFSVSRLPVKSNRALQEEQRAFKNISSGSDSMINSGLSSTLPVFHIPERNQSRKGGLLMLSNQNASRIFSATSKRARDGVRYPENT